MNTKSKFFLLLLCLFAGYGQLKAQNDAAVLAEATRKYMELKFGMFIHFGINTYTDKEWTDGKVPAALYNPKELDTDQWCEAAKAAGMKYIVFTTKHHDGFCNWNTKYTDYSVKKTSYKKDVLKDLAASCKKYDLKLGLYYSLWDCHEPSYADNYRYTEYMKNQLDELLSNYGDILLIWFDGVWDKCTGFGFDGYKAQGEEIMQIWRNDGAYNWQWDHIYSFIKHKNPTCLVMNNSGIDFTGIPLMPVDIRTGERGNKKSVNKMNWKFANQEVVLPMQVEDIISRKFWFYHAGDTTVKSKEEILLLKKEAEDMNANLLLNVGPMENGQLRPQDISLLQSLSGTK